MGSAFLVIDKPPGITSHDVVAAVRAVTGIKKVGHTGTLDPFATGVLPLALGGATRLVQFLDESVKIYDATIGLGRATDTGDPTGRTIREAPLPTAGIDEVRAILRTFRGERMQAPPAFSAVKVSGRPMYDYARRGEDVVAEPRRITLHDLELREYDGTTLRVVITCSRGTYARVLADDIGRALESAGHLVALQRSRSGPFHIADALDLPTLAELVAAVPGSTWQEVLLARGDREGRVAWRPRDDVLAALLRWMRRPLDVLTHLALADVSPAEVRRLRSGGPPPPPPPGLAADARYLVVCGDEVIAVAGSGPRGPHSLRVFPAGDGG